jgi:protein-S-isoprenylcysteine O-methyltransferase Ste14
MQVRELVGAGDRIVLLTLPFVIVGVGANVLWPAAFRLGFGAAGTILGIVAAAIGVLLWLTSVVQILTFVPKGKLITRGPYALLLHPLYTSVALLVIPGVGLLLDTWLGFAVGVVLYGSARLFAPAEERDLAARFPQDYPAYRKRVILPWL